MAAYTNSFLGFPDASIDPKFDANLDYPSQADMAEMEEAEELYEEMARDAYDAYLMEKYASAEDDHLEEYGEVDF